MKNSIKIDELNSAIMDSLETYHRDTVTGLKKTTNRAMKDLVSNTRATAPVGNRSKHYKDSITSKTQSESSFGISKLWYVKGPDYRLSHLLNNGHALRDGGRYPGTNFVGNAVDAIVPQYISQVEELLRNGKGNS